MPRRSMIGGLPAEVRAWLDRTLAAGNFSGYELLELELKQRGYSIGKSSIHRYGQKLERRLAAIKASTEAAAAIAAAAPDDEDNRSNAIISLVQTEIFEALLAMQEAEETDDPGERVAVLGKAAKSIATLTRASVTRNKWAGEVREKLERAKQVAASEAEAIAMKAGMSDDDWALIRAKFLGIEVS